MGKLLRINLKYTMDCNLPVKKLALKHLL